MRVLVTGASGFVGQAMVDRLCRDGHHDVRAAVRDAAVFKNSNAEYELVGNLGPDTDWRSCLRNVDVIVHLAARVHVLNEQATDSLQEFRKTNVVGTRWLARQAVEAGVRRFVFMSSTKVNGENTTANRPFTTIDVAAPCDAYGISKHEAEQALRHLSAETGMEVVIVRPSLVYGPGVKANFRSMLQWLHKELPLPLGAVRNRRSLVALDNLVDFAVCSIDHPAAANEVFFVSDGTDLSTTELLQLTAAALGKRARLVAVPASILKGAAQLFGRRDMAQRLLGSLQVDMSKTLEKLGWTPPVTMDEALSSTARHFLAHDVR